MARKKIDSRSKKYAILNQIYDELISKDYTVNQATGFVRKCRIMSPNMQQLKPSISMGKVKECLREAKKEVKMY